MTQVRLLLLTAFLATASVSAATTAEDQATLAHQAELDQACEAARTVKLVPLRKQLFNECMNSKNTTDTAQDCTRKTADYNGNRYEAAPMFYDLPACVSAFEFQKANPVNR